MAGLYFNPQNPIDQKGNRASRPFWMFLDALTQAIQSIPTAGTVTHTGALSANAVVVGNGTDDIKTLAALGTSGQVLTSNGAGTPPAFQSFTSGNVTSATAVGSEPGSPASGDLDLYTNGHALVRYSGSAWVPWGPIFPLTDPSLASISTWVNQGGASVSTTNGGITLNAPATSGDNIRLRVKTAPATPYVITARMLSYGAPGASSWGIGFRQSSDGKLHLFMCGGSASGSTPGIFSIKFTNPTTFSASYSSTIAYNLNTGFPPAYLRIADDGTNRLLSYSMDGVNFTPYTSIGRTDFLTADQVGFFANASSSTIDAGTVLLSWKET